MGRLGAFIKFLAIVSEAIFLQFIHVVGLLGFVAAAALGWYRKPSWWVPILAVALGVASDKFFSSDVAGLLEKAHKAEERGGFMIVVYFVICAVGYVAGAYGRVHFFNDAQALPEAKPVSKLRRRK
ncbi:MAG: hypothetical protein WAK01_11590 [Methylocystis sp.]